MRAALLVAALLLISPPAFAHKLAVRRTLILEPAKARELHVLVQLRVPSGDPRRALAQLADVNHDGKIDPEEEKNMRRMLALRALDGVTIAAGTATIAIDNLETKLKIDGEEGPVDLIAHGVALLPPPPQAQTISVTTSPAGEPIELVVLPGSRPVVSADRGSPRNGGLTLPLGIGDRVRIQLSK